ncbi:centromere-associated protein E isoform X3 [Hemitrygon akajei]|uniref:centromere-associated protein E isoform X3 n=1 Tax=Hemitrygon akajei TaxID=2704970 RepID=UPI003BF955C0
MDKRQESAGVKCPGMVEESAVQVCVRLRPPNAREKSLQGGSGTHPEVHWKTENQTISQINGGKSFSFDRVFHENETTQTIYTEVAHSIVCSITEGYNGTIFAYGQTSSGKTYTMMGNANTPGLIPLAICNLFKVINDMQNREFLLRVSYLEIYNESVSDLLSDSKGKPLEIREDMERTIYVAELIEEVAVTFEDVMKWVKKGERNRHYGETKMNERSSRSHTIFRVIVESRDKNNEAVKVAHLNLVDLAGSERASQTGAEGVRLKEGCNINRSLFILGQVIKKLSDGQSGFLNYRDSKLTRILQNSLGGNARTLIICTIAPCAFEETLSTLQFASTAKFMKNTPHVNEVLDDQAMLKRYRKEIMDLKNHLEELTSETRVHEMEKAQLLSEKYHLQLEHEQKIKNLTRMLVRVSPDEDQLSAKARRKRRFTWAPGKVRASLTTATDNATKMIKLDEAFQELDELPEEIPDDQQSDVMPGCSSQITVRRGGSLGYQVPSFEDSLYFRDQSQISFTGILYDESPKDDLKKRILELENELGKELDLTKEKEKQNVHLKCDVESLKMENDKHKEEIRQLKQLLEEKERTEKYFKMENDKQNDEIEELKRLRDGYEERREIEEFEFLEKVVEKEEKAQQKHEIAKLKELVRNSEVYNQELEAELKTKTDRLKDQEQKLLLLQKRLDELKQLSDGQVDLETLIDQNKHLQQSLNDAEVVTCDAKKKSAILRSENLELKETMNEMTMKYQQMEKDVQLYCKKLDTEQSRYKQMQSDLQKELKFVYSENIKLTSLLDGKVPKDVLDRVQLEKSIADLNQQLEKAGKENISLQQEVAFLSQNNLLPEKIDELEKQVLKLTEELNGVTSERDNLLVGKEENDNQLANLRGEVSLIVQERDKLQEAVNSLQNERIHQENLNDEQQNKIQCRMESFKTELELYCRQLEEERAKCLQLQHNIEDKEGKVKELEQQLTHEIAKQNEINDKLSKASEDIKLLNEVKEELMTKLQVLTKDNEELAMLQPKSQKDEDLLNVSSAVETTEIKNLTEQLLILEENCKTISEEKENLYKELSGLQAERDQLKCDLQDSIEMSIENQAELRRLHDKVKLHQDVAVELKKSLADKEFLINEEKKKASEALDRAQEEVQYQQQLVKELKIEIQEKKDLLLNIQTNNPEIVDKKQKVADELYCLEAERKALLTEIEELRVRAFKDQEAEVQKEQLKQQVQQLENDKLTLSQQKDNLLETLKCIRAEKDEMKKVLEEKTEVTQKQGEELLHTVSQRDMLLAEIERLKDHLSKEKKAASLEDEFSQKLQHLESEKSSLVTERDELLEKLRCIEVEKEEMKILHGNAEMVQKQAEELHLNSLLDVQLDEIKKLRAQVSKEHEAVIQEDEFNQQFQQLEEEKSCLLKERDELQEMLKCVKAEQDEMKKFLQENSVVAQKQEEELHHTVSQCDMLLAEIKMLRACVANEEQVEIREKEFNQQIQQLKDEKSCLLKERDELQEMLNVVKANQAEMKKVLHENSVVAQKQEEELHHTVSQRDMLLAEIKTLRACVANEEQVEIREKEFNQQIQQLKDEKSCLLKERDELQEMLNVVKANQAEMKKVLHENSVVVLKQEEELHHTVSQRDLLLAEIETLRARVSKEEEQELQEKEVSQRFQQLEDEKSCLLKERDELQEMLKCIKAEQGEMKKVLQENSEMTQKQEEELHRTVSQRDMLLAEIERLRSRVSKEEEVEIREREFYQQFQQLEGEKSHLIKERDELQKMLKVIKAEQDEMKKVLQENSEVTQKQEEELHHTVSQRDMLLAEIERLRSRVSKEEEVEIREKEFNQRIQQLEDEKSCLLKERDELQEKLKCIKVEQEEMKKALPESSEVLMMEERRDEELSKMDTSLEKQIVALKDKTLTESLTPENEEIQAEINKLSNHLQEKDSLLQEIIQSLFQMENEYKIELAKTNQQLSREGEEWNELLVKFCSMFPEESTESISIKKLQEENQKVYEQLVLWRIHFLRVMSTVPQNKKRYQVQITECDLCLADEKKKNKELCIQLQSLKNHVSDSPMLELTSEEKNPEILRLSTLINFKENHLMNAQQTLSDLKLKYENHLRSTKNGLSSKAEARKVLQERISNTSFTNASKTIEEIEDRIRILNQDLQLQNETVQNEATFSRSKQNGYVMYIRNTWNQVDNQKKENEKLLLEIETVRQQSFNKNGSDPVLAMENQKLKEKMKTDEQLFQAQKQEEELHHTVSQRDMLLAEIERLRSRVSKEEVEIQKKEFNQRIQQLEDEKSCLLKERDELQEKLKCIKVEQEEMKKALPESSEVLKMEKRRDEELSKMDTSLEKQIFDLKDKTLTESTTPENKEIEAEINKLSNHLQEKDRLLLETIQSLFQMENEYKIELAKTNQQLSREGEEWNELLVKFCSMFPEESTESISIKKLQEENQKVYEQLVLWRSNFLRVMSTVPQNIKRYQAQITECDLCLADEKKKNKELCIQLQSLKNHVSDSPMLELTSEEKNPEILRLSTLINFKENHLMNAQQTLSDLKLKFENHLRSSKNGLSSKAEARKVLQERISNTSFTNASKTIEEIEDRIRILNQDLQLQNETVRNEATFSRSKQNGYVMYIRNTWNQVDNQKKENEKLLLEIETVRQQSFNKNGSDPVLAMENQKLKEKMKTDEQLFQTMGINIQELKMALTTSQDTNKLQEGKIKQLQTELSSRTSENKLEDLQTSLLKKDNQINVLEEALKQLQAKLDVGAQPYEEMKELKNRLFILEMERVKESNNYEKQISSLAASLEHNKELCRQTKEKLRRYQQEQDTTIMFESNNEKRSTDESLTCGGGSGIVQNALVLVLKSEKAKLIQDLNCVKKENARLARTMSELKYENARWKDRALKLQGKDRISSEHQRENDPPTLTPCPEEDVTLCSLTEQSTVPKKVKTSEFLLPAIKTGAKQDENSLTSEKMLILDSPKASSFGTESKWLLPGSKIFDNSQLGFSEAESPQRKPKSDENERVDWWPKPSASDPQCKMQ